MIFMQFGSGYFDLQQFLERDISIKSKCYTNTRQPSYGLPQWSVKEWRGCLYSAQTSSQNFLKEYAKVFNCVEVSSTFYAPVSSETISQWRDCVQNEFRFLPKWPKKLTHQQLLSSDKNEIKKFIHLMDVFEEKLGTTLLQLPPHFSRSYSRELFLFLEQIPQGFPLSLELRHGTWFMPDQPNLDEKLFQYLAKKNISMVLTDTPARPDLFHLNSTGPNFVVRYLSDSVEEHDQARLEWWQQKIVDLSEQTNLYFVLHREDNLRTPELIDLLNKDLAQCRRQQALGGAQDPNSLEQLALKLES